jgi:hypothetical protein
LQPGPNVASMNQFELTFTPLWDKTALNKAANPRANGFVTRVVADPAVSQAKESSVSYGQNNTATGSQPDLIALNYSDTTFDAKLAMNKERILRLNGVPNGVVVKYWADESGFFMYFQNGNDAEAPHYISGSSRLLSINGGPLINLDDKRVRVSNMTIIQDLKQTQHLPESMSAFGYGSVTKDGAASDVKAYYIRLSRLSWTSLDFQERLLGSAASDSSNPYIRMSLADIYAAKALKVAVDALIIQNTSNFDDPTILPNLQKAYDLNESTKSLVLSPLKDLGIMPQMNTVLPWAPFDVDPRGRYGNGFFLGAYDQAYARNAALKALINKIRLGGKPELEIPQEFQLQNLVA